MPRLPRWRAERADRGQGRQGLEPEAGVSSDTVIVAVRAGASTVAQIAAATRLTPHQTRARIRDLERMHVVTVRTDPRFGWIIRPVDDPHDRALATSAAFRESAPLAPPDLYPQLERVALKHLRHAGKGTAPQIADAAGITYRDALGALWRNVSSGEPIRVIEFDGLHAMFVYQGRA